MEEKENEMMVVNDNENYVVLGFGDLGRNSKTKTEVITNINDDKKIFNLENKVDLLLNDCENEKIRVKEVLIKKYEKPLDEPIINEETGEIIKDKEFSMSCVLVDVADKSYATGSKSFTIQIMKYLQLRASRGMGNEPFDIRIIRKKVSNSNNKVLSFELI